MNPIGIMLGRLSPRPDGRVQSFPRATWRDEFGRARACGFALIEWLVTTEAIDDNPIWSGEGRGEIRERAAGAGVRVTSMCADFLIDQPLVGVDDGCRRERVDRLGRLVACAAEAGVTTIVVPAIETAGVRDEREAAALLDALAGPARLAAPLGVRLAIEADLPVERYRALLTARPPLGLEACCDLGNAASLGFDPAADLVALGPLVGSVHVKDRRRGGPSVPLGQGDVDLDACADALATIGYRGPLVLETPVGADPVASAHANLAFLRARLGDRRGQASAP